MDVVDRDEDRLTRTNVDFEKIYNLPTMEDVRKYLDWDATVNPLPGEVKWYTDDKKTWEERRQQHLERLAEEKERLRLERSNPSKPRVPNQKFLLREFLAEKEVKHSSEFLAMFEASMMERGLRSASLAIYNKLWDKFLQESSG